MVITINEYHKPLEWTSIALIMAATRVTRLLVVGFALIALISLIPNVLPLVFVAGLMGLIGIDLKFSTVVIFTIGFGIAVDDTIHLLVRYKIELPNARDKKDALFQSIKTTGKALIITSFVLSSGFLTFLLAKIGRLW